MNLIERSVIYIYDMNIVRGHIAMTILKQYIVLPLLHMCSISLLEWVFFSKFP